MLVSKEWQSGILEVAKIDCESLNWLSLVLLHDSFPIRLKISSSSSIRKATSAVMNHVPVDVVGVTIVQYYCRFHPDNW